MAQSLAHLIRIAVPAVLLAGCGLGGPAHDAASPNAGATVTMGFGSFDPETIHVKAGQTVEFRNTALITHSVTDDAKLAEDAKDASAPAGATPFNSGDIAPGRSSPRPSPSPAPTAISAPITRVTGWWPR